MLKLYRRHGVRCPHRSINYRRCQCPIYVKGTLGRDKIRQSLNQTSWDAASRIIAAWVQAGQITGLLTGERTIGSAVTAFTKDAIDRGLTPATLKKYRLLFARLIDYYHTQSTELLSAITLDTLSQFRATWPGAALTKYKTQERLKFFFYWCMRRGWLRENPAAGLSTIRVPPTPTLPFTAEDMSQILATVDRYPTLNSYGYDNRARIRAMVLLLRWSGLRIRDAVTLKRTRIQDDKLFLYTQKTGTPVLLPLPQVVIEAIAALPGERPFWITGNGEPESAISNWHRTFKRLFRLAGLPDGHPHRFRDTFAVGLLLDGVDLADVAILLGHASVKVTEKHYAPWVRARQTRLESIVRSSWTSADGL